MRIAQDQDIHVFVVAGEYLQMRIAGLHGRQQHRVIGIDQGLDRVVGQLELDRDPAVFLQPSALLERGCAVVGDVVGDGFLVDRMTEVVGDGRDTGRRTGLVFLSHEGDIQQFAAQRLAGDGLPLLPNGLRNPVLVGRHQFEKRHRFLVFLLCAKPVGFHCIGCAQRTAFIVEQQPLDPGDTALRLGIGAGLEAEVKQLLQQGNGLQVESHGFERGQRLLRFAGQLVELGGQLDRRSVARLLAEQILGALERRLVFVLQIKQVDAMEFDGAVFVMTRGIIEKCFGTLEITVKRGDLGTLAQ